MLNLGKYTLEAGEKKDLLDQIEYGWSSVLLKAHGCNWRLASRQKWNLDHRLLTQHSIGACTAIHAELWGCVYEGLKTRLDQRDQVTDTSS